MAPIAFETAGEQFSLIFLSSCALFSSLRILIRLIFYAIKVTAEA